MGEESEIKHSDFERGRINEEESYTVVENRERCEGFQKLRMELLAHCSEA